MELFFEIPGPVKGKDRPRFYNGHVMTSKNTLSYENWVKQCFLSSHPEHKPIEGAIVAMISVYHAIPKSASKKKAEAMLCGGIVPTKKPDCDNIAKVILDSLNGIAYKDDSQVFEMYIQKRYAGVDSVRVKLAIKDGEVS